AFPSSKCHRFVETYMLNGKIGIDLFESLEGVIPPFPLFLVPVERSIDSFFLDELKSFVQPIVEVLIAFGLDEFKKLPVGDKRIGDFKFFQEDTMSAQFVVIAKSISHKTDLIDPFVKSQKLALLLRFGLEAGAIDRKRRLIAQDVLEVVGEELLMLLFMVDSQDDPIQDLLAERFSIQ